MGRGALWRVASEKPKLPREKGFCCCWSGRGVTLGLVRRCLLKETRPLMMPPPCGCCVGGREMMSYD